MKEWIRGTHFHFTDEGSGEPIVLLHGFTSSLNTWNFLKKDLIKRNFRVIQIDLIGHGKTFTLSNNHMMETVCKDLFSLLEKLGISECTLVGYSQGGRIALSFTNYFPQSVKKLVLEGSSPGIENVYKRKKRKEADILLSEEILKYGLSTFVRRWESLPLFKTQKRLPVEVQNKIRRERLSQTKEGLALALKCLSTGRQPSWWQHLYKIKQRVLLIVGAKDTKFVKINKKMNNLFEKSQLEIVPQSGHAVHLEQPERFKQILLQFICEKGASENDNSMEKS